jgi:hypothetical protein
MKKKKKLVLSRETLANLEKIEQVAGGYSQPSQCGSCIQQCTFSNGPSCNTCGVQTCTTAFC